MTAHFITELHAKKVKEGGNSGRSKWRLTAPLYFFSDIIHDIFIVPMGFETDFASVPRLPLAYLLTGDTAHASAVLHDYLVREKILRWNLAADVFGEAMKAEGVPGWRRFLMVNAVKLAGFFKK